LTVQTFFLLLYIGHSIRILYLYFIVFIYLLHKYLLATMAASKFLIALVLLLAVTGSMGQAMNPAAQKIVAACGVPVALKVQGLAPKCAKEAAKAKAKACPASCKSLIAAIPNPTCGAAVNAASPKATQAKIAAVSIYSFL
jgi:hypothetical protein